MMPELLLSCLASADRAVRERRFKDARVHLADYLANRQSGAGRVPFGDARHAFLLRCVSMLAVLALGCASGPQGLAQTTPQACSVVIDAHDGGQVTISGQLAIYARGTGDADQLGNEVRARTNARVDSSVTTGAP